MVSTKPISERRRQQNLRAQKNYNTGEKQKRRLEVLEELLSAGAGPVDPDQATGSTCATSDTSQSQSTPQQPTRGTTDHEPSPPTNIGIDDADAMKILAATIAPEKLEWVKTRMDESNITIQDIIKAGLDVLQQHVPGTTAHGVRTDRILVPKNGMRAYSLSVPDVYVNHLHVKLFSTVAALRANAEALDINFDDLIIDDTISPFYAASATPDLTEAVVRTKFHHLTADLQPTISQVRHAHHPYIDLIPSRTFRQRVIQAISVEPPMIDEDDLCKDIEHDGLICWGSQVRSREGSPVGSGAPWDIKSWEAQTWFMKKWWFLIGGKDGELFKQSQWWHALRGDKLGGEFF
ncbi:unnamed protein product [Clonostachys solani]|uniref:BZIP domain-containing protein n=1 Tax=Clonostachys solani TaxID=160281 RepID=A0A9N9Z9E2_9HYPO|nr:unnamed protein product [Clonostachys solani]